MTQQLEISAHESYRLENVFFPSIYYYDPADDGPECEVITRILASHPLYVSGVEKQSIQYSRYLDAGAFVLFGKSFADIGEESRSIVRQGIAKTLGRRMF